MALSADLRGLLGPARDQGPRPTCLAFAMSDAHAVSHGLSHPLAANYAHYQAARRDRATMNQPVTTVSMQQALEEDGQPSETACPYSVPCDDDWSPAVIRPLWKRASTRRSETPSSALLDALTASRVSVLTLAITEPFYTPDAGTFEIADDASSVVGHHAVVVVGMRGERASSGAFLVRNSWGSEWGLEGHAWLQASYVDARAIDIVQF